MTSDRNTITDAATPALSMYNALAAALTAEGYTLVDTQVISTRTHKVWKSAAANNLAGLDWYLDVAYTTTGAGYIYLCPFEFYDPATHLGYRGVTYGSGASGNMAAPYYAQNGNTGATLEAGSNTITPANLTVANLAGSCTAVSFGYWISVTPTRVIMLNSNSPTQVVYCGFYEPDSDHVAIAGSAIYPLILAQIPNNPSYAGQANPGTAFGLTRMPLITGANWYSNATNILTDAGYQYKPQIPGGLETSAHKSASRMGIYLSPGLGASVGALLGRFYDIRMANAANTVTRGDTVTLSGDTATWRMCSAGSNIAVLFRDV